MYTYAHKYTIAINEILIICTLFIVYYLINLYLHTKLYSILLLYRTNHIRWFIYEINNQQCHISFESITIYIIFVFTVTAQNITL